MSHARLDFLFVFSPKMEAPYFEQYSNAFLLGSIQFLFFDYQSPTGPGAGSAASGSILPWCVIRKQHVADPECRSWSNVGPTFESFRESAALRHRFANRNDTFENCLIYMF